MMVLEDFIKITGKKFYSECLLGGDVLYRMSFFLKQNLAFDRCLSCGGDNCATMFLVIHRDFAICLVYMLGGQTVHIL